MSDHADANPQPSAEEKRRLLARLLSLKVEAGRGWEPLSYAQRFYWALQNAAPPDTPVNHEAFAWRVPANFQFDLLVDQARRLCERHPVLRATYRDVDGIPRQRFDDRITLPPEVTDAAGWSIERLNEQILADAAQPFDLATGPLLRMRFYQRGREDALIVTVLHHLGIDLWSMVLLMEELKTLYLGQMLRTPQELPAVRCHYRDFVAWQEQLVDGPAGQRLKEYWSRQFSRPPEPLAIPTDHARPARRTFRGGSVGFEVGVEIARRVKALARNEQTTLFTILLAAFQVVLMQWSGQVDFLVATRGASRSRSEFERVVGCFTNTLALRANLSDEPTFRRLLERVGRTVSAALEHQDYPFALLTQEHRITRPGELLCDVCFLLQKPSRRGAEPAFRQDGSFGIRSQTTNGALFALGTTNVDILPIDLPVARYDLELEMLETGESFSGWMRFSTDLFAASTVERMVRTFMRVLDEATAEPDRRCIG